MAELLDKNDRIKQLNEVLQKKSASNLCNNCKKAILDGGSLNNDATSSDLLDPSSHVKVQFNEYFSMKYAYFYRIKKNWLKFQLSSFAI